MKFFLIKGSTHFKICDTCHHNAKYCQGHFGEIVLPTPVYHPLLFSNFLMIIKSICLKCYKFNFPKRFRDFGSEISLNSESFKSEDISQTSSSGNDAQSEDEDNQSQMSQFDNDSVNFINNSLQDSSNI